MGTLSAMPKCDVHSQLPTAGVRALWSVIGTRIYTIIQT